MKIARSLLAVLLCTLVAVLGYTSTAQADTVPSAENTLLSANGEHVDIDAYINAARVLVDEFALEKGLIPATYTFIPDKMLVKAPQRCMSPFDLDRRLDSGTFLYCQPNRTVYIGYSMTRKLVDLFVYGGAMGIAHEFGHHLQHLSNEDRRGADIIGEYGADCVSGAWLAWFNDRTGNQFGWDEVAGIVRYVDAISSKNPKEIHGREDMRSANIIVGYRYGIERCNAYLPTVPTTAPG